MRTRFWPTALGAALFALPACVDQSPVAPELVTPVGPSSDAIVLQCLADVTARSITCDPQLPGGPEGLYADRLIGGQDRYVRLTSSDTEFDTESFEFRSMVTVQNLTRHTLGTDGTLSPGVRIFFHSGPVAVSGTGEIEVQNADGMGTFTGAQQPYFEYSTVLSPLQISAGREWVFLLDPDVTAFAFVVYVSAPLVEEAAPLLGPVWSGVGNTAWDAADNWEGGRLPAADSSVTIPTDSMLTGGYHPILSQDVSVDDLRVGTGSTLNLAGYQIIVGGNLDVSGAITDGSVRLTNESAIMGGELPAVEIEGGARLQRPTVMRDALTISGSLTAQDHPLVISLPGLGAE